jgi:hypothetical protein
MDLVTVVGRSIALLNQNGIPTGEQRIIRSFSELPNGAYFLVIRSASDLVLRKIIL